MVVKFVLSEMILINLLFYLYIFRDTMSSTNSIDKTKRVKDLVSVVRPGVCLPETSKDFQQFQDKKI